MTTSLWELYWFNARLGLIPFLGGIPYFRYLEYRLALTLGGDLEGKRILDLGSGRRGRFPLLLLTRLGESHVYSTDIVDYRREQYQRARRLEGQDVVEKRFFVQEQDARSLTFPDAYFDRIFAISTLEHIPGDGDTEAALEMARVLRPGGSAIIAVPFRAAGEREEHRTIDVYFRRHREPVFYERMYDMHALRRRLIDPSGLEVDQVTFYGERGFRFWETFYARLQLLPMFLQWMTLPFRLSMPILAHVFLSTLDEEDQGLAQGVIFVGRRP